MSAAETNVNAPLWQASNLSLIAFPVEPQLSFDVNWWRTLTNSDDFESTRRKTERIDDGEYGDHGLKLQMNPLQTIWLSGPLNKNIATTTDGHPTLGSFESARDDFVEVMDRWLHLPLMPIKRISFTGDLLLKVPTREAAYAELDKCLPSLKVDSASSDLLYRINRKRQSNVGDWEINRLSTWGAIEFRSMFGIVGSGTAELASNGFACALQFDVNTSGDRRQEFSPNTLPAIFRELVDLASEIARNGDIP